MLLIISIGCWKISVRFALDSFLTFLSQSGLTQYKMTNKYDSILKDSICACMTLLRSIIERCIFCNVCSVKNVTRMEYQSQIITYFSFFNI